MGDRLHETEGREVLAPSGTESEKAMGKPWFIEKTRERKFFS